MTNINLLAVLVSAVAATVIGFLWYGPLFGKSWLALKGTTPEKIAEMKKKGMTAEYIITFIASAVMAYVLSLSIAVRPFITSSGTLVLGFWIWLGFIATTMIASVLWDKQPMKLFWINSLYYLVALWAMGLILVSWR
jgi:Protein of unknown function (DUF1761)